jgi:uncharacterized membrane protein YidH (DUF202 family)
MQTLVILLAIATLIVGTARWLRSQSGSGKSPNLHSAPHWLRITMITWRIALAVAAVLCLLQYLSPEVFLLVFFISMIAFDLNALLA